MRFSIVALTCFSIHSLCANPMGPEVIHGQVAMTQEGSSLVIEASDRAIINWQDFSIAPGELTQFIQPHARASVLNRVVGHEKSLIQGMLKSNGQVYLINPFGIVVGSEGVINAGAFFGSTHDITDQNFIDGGRLTFRGESKEAIVNQGTIEVDGRDIAFIAARVQNKGELVAENGVVSSGVGMEVYFQPDQEQRIYVKRGIELPASQGKMGEGYSNEGVIRAIQSQIAVDGNLYQLAMNLEGDMEVIGSDQLDGMIFCSAGDGRMEIRGDLKGDEAHFFGKQIDVHQGYIDLSSDSGDGGLLQMGRDETGRFNEPNSQVVWVSNEVEVCADGGERGSGGKVSVWGDEAAIFTGSLSARGGNEGGDGGFFEVSSHKHPLISGPVDMTAPMGKVGTSYIDPANILIQEGSSTIQTRTTANGVEFIFPSESATLGIEQINSLLNGSNVIIDTSSTSGSFSQPGDINWNDAGVFESPHTLTLMADRDITFNAPIITSGSFEATAKRNISLPSSGIPILIDCRGGDITMNAGESMTIAAPSGQQLLTNHGLAATGQVALKANQFSLTSSDTIAATIRGPKGVSISPNSTGGSASITTDCTANTTTITSTSGVVELGQDGASYSTISMSTSGGEGITLSANNGIGLLATEQVKIEAANGAININQSGGTGDIVVTGTSIELLGGSADQGSIEISHATPGAIAVGGDSIHLIAGSSPTAGFTAIRSTGGAEVGIKGNLVLTSGGGSGNNGASIESSGASSPIKVSGGVVLNGGSSDAILSTTGNSSDIMIDGEMTATLNASSSGGNAYISTHQGAIGVKQTGDIALNGSANGRAYISAGEGEVIVTSGDGVSLNAGPGSSGELDTSITAGGPITVFGKSVALKGGESGAGDHDAYISTRGDNQPITVVSDSLSLQGGGGAQADAYIQTSGNSSNIMIMSGIDMEGGSGTSSVAEIITTGKSDISVKNGSAVHLKGGTGGVCSSTIEAMGKGAVSISTDGGLTLEAGTSGVGGVSQAYISSNNQVDLVAGGNIEVRGGSGEGFNSAYITTTENNSNLSIQCNSILLQGGDGSQSSAYIETEDNQSNIKVRGGMLLHGGSGSQSFATIETVGGGYIDIDSFSADQNVAMVAGTGENSLAGIRTLGSGDIKLVAGGGLNLSTQALDNGQHLLLESAGSLTIGANHGSIVIDNYNPYSKIQAAQSLKINARAGDINIQGHSHPYILPSSRGEMLVEAGSNLYISDYSSLQAPTHVPITLVCDGIHSVPYKLGSSGVFLGPHTKLDNGGGVLKLYTSEFIDNRLEGLLNGVHFEGSEYMADAHNQEFVYYPYGKYTPPYTVYYKLIPLKTQGVLNELNESVSQLFYEEDRSELSFQMMTLWDVFNYRSTFALEDTAELLNPYPMQLSGSFYRTHASEAVALDEEEWDGLAEPATWR